MKKNNWTLLIILIASAFLRFYGLNWGLPYPFHPDERNMADAITRFSSSNLDPKFYAYGQFPLYLAYFTGKFFFSIIEKQNLDRLTFIQAILSLRFWSALFSTATIYVAYLISKKLFSKKLFTVYCLLFTATAVAFTPGLIQSAHFGTTESILTFCFLIITYLSLKILEKSTLKKFFLTAFFLGIALSSKISAAIFVFPFTLVCLWQLKTQNGIKKKLRLVLKFIFALSVTLSLTLVFSPYLVLAYKESRGTLLYEISVAQGKSQVFYTRQFINTVPILFQLQKIFPYALGWPTFILGFLGFLFIILQLIKKNKNYPQITNYPAGWRDPAKGDGQLLITLISFLVYFLSNAFLFTKWTRFMTPIFPFFSIFAAYLINRIIFLPKSKKLLTAYCLLFTAVSIVPGLLFSSIYFKPDIRLTASEWIYQNIPSGSHVLSETANVVDIPILSPNYQLLITNYFLNPVSFDFYSLDENPKVFERLLNELEKSDYIFIPSRRLFVNQLRLPKRYPLTAKYYQLLFSGKLGFKEIKTFPPFPQLLNYSITQLLFSDERSEETFTVFDHPVIRIYKKIIPYNKSDYEKLFKI